MRKDTKKRFCRLLFVFVIFILCFFGYYNVQSKEISLPSDVENTIIIDRKEESFENPLEDTIFNTVPVFYEEETLPDNYIQVGGTTQLLMKDLEGNHFYLNHNLQGVYDGVGVPYVDYRYDFNGLKTIIYAHSIKGGKGPFQMLQKYHNDFSFYQNNRYITIDYQNHTYLYEIFSVYVSVADNEESEGLEFYHRDRYTKEEWGNTLQKYKSYSEYDTGVSVSANDKILILQTCSMDDQYYEKYYRYNLLIMGKLVF